MISLSIKRQVVNLHCKWIVVVTYLNVILVILMIRNPCLLAYYPSKDFIEKIVFLLKKKAVNDKIFQSSYRSLLLPQIEMYKPLKWRYQHYHPRNSVYRKSYKDQWKVRPPMLTVIIQYVKMWISACACSLWKAIMHLLCDMHAHSV